MQVGEELSAASAARKTCMRISYVVGCSHDSKRSCGRLSMQKKQTSSGADMPSLHTEACDHLFGAKQIS